MALERSADSTSPGWESEQEARIEEIVAGYIERLNGGEEIRPEAVLAQHPDIAGEILDHLQCFIEFKPGSENDEPVGTLGDYTLRRQIGRGGMGVVYEAWENSMDRRVALKVLPAGIAADDRAFQRFMREAKTAGKLNHPNVVGVYSTGVKEGTPWYSMEFVEGETLAQVITRLKEAPLEEKTPFGFPRDDVAYYSALAHAFADVADGLQHAHSKGVVHRDIKPSNLILDKEGRLRILDFGLARLEGQESLTQSGDFLGTPLYMSPEQARRKKIPIDHRTDNYSLGATLYEMLTLRPPFQGKDHHDTLSQIIERDPVEPRKLNPRIPRDLETIVLKCLRKDPADRYGTAEALGQDLRRFVRGDPIEARPQSRWERVVRRTWRTRRAISLGLLLVLVGAVFAGQLWSWGRERQIRLEEQYDSLVRQAVLRLELVSEVQKDESGGWDWWLNTDPSNRTAVDPAVLALDDIEKASALFPDRHDVLYHRARALLYLGRREEALGVLDVLGHGRRPFVPALTLQAQLFEVRGDPESAARLLNAARTAASEPWENAWVEVSEAWRGQDFNRAVEAYDKLLAAVAPAEPFPGSALATRMGRGSAQMALRNYAYALEDFSIAAYFSPGAMAPAIRQGEAMLLLGRKNEAERLFRRVFEATPRKDEAAIRIARLYFLQGLEQENLEWIGRLGSPSLRESQKAWAHQDSGRYQEAVAAGRRALELDPTNSDTHLVLAFAYNMLGRSELAVLVLDEALQLPRGIASWNILHYLGWSLSLDGRLTEAIARYEEASRLALNPGRDYSRIADAYLALGDDKKGDDWARRAHEADPQNLLVDLHRGWSLQLIGRFDEAFEASSRHPDDGFCVKDMGYTRFLQGRWDEALEIFHRGQKLKLFSPGSFICAALIQARRGKATAALEEIVPMLETAPVNGGAHRLLASLLRKHAEEIDRESLKRLVQALDQGRAKEAKHPMLLNSQALALAALPDDESKRKAIEAALDGLDAAEGSGDFVSELCTTLRSILTAQAPRGACLFTCLTRLPTYAGIEVLLEGGGEAAICEELLKSGDKGVEEDARAGRRQLFLRAALFEAMGRPSEAESLLHDLVAQETDRPEPLILLAKVLRAQSKAGEAEKELRSALESAPERDRQLWNAWLDLAYRDLKLSPAQLLERFPRVPAKEVPPPKAGLLPELEAEEARRNHPEYAGDAHWLLEQLAAGRSLRIRCGGDALTLPNGEVWGQDCFFLGGRNLNAGEINIQGTEKEELYRRCRTFFSYSSEDGRAEYAIPVPPGRWRLRLHFAETETNWPGQRRVDVYLQGKVVLKDFDILAEAPFRAALEKVFETQVEEGPLEIRLEIEPQVVGVLISALEVERVE